MPIIGQGRRTAVPGDHVTVPSDIAIKKGVISHHGIVVENNNIIHFIKRERGNLPVIEETIWSEFIKPYKMYTNPYTDVVYPDNHPRADTPDVVVARARYALANRDKFLFRYNIAHFNCEHFATWCELGPRLYHSDQVNRHPILAEIAEFLTEANQVIKLV